MIKNKYAAFALFTALFLLICNGLDYSYTTFITGDSYVFSVKDDLAIPLAVAIVVGFFVFLRKKKEAKES